MPGWPLHVFELLLALVVILGPVPLALALVHRAGSGDRGALANGLAVCTYAVALQISIGLMLGMVGVLHVWTLVAVELAMFTGGAVLLRRTELPRLLPSRPFAAPEAGAFLVLLIAGGAGLADLVVRPTRNFDSLAYHLPVMARWVSASSLEIFEELGQVAFYPSHWELLSTMLQLPLRQDLLISVPNLLAWAQLALAIVFVSRALGANRTAGMLCAALVVMTPSVLSRLDAIQPDIALAAIFLTALGFALRPTRELDQLDLSVVLVSLGLLAGLKLSGPVYALMVLPVALLGPAFQPRAVIARLGDPGLRRVLLTGAAAAVGLGLFWYLRNWIALGNPFGDLEVAFFDGSITRAELQRGALSSVFRPGSGEDWSVLWGVLREWIGAGGLLLLVAALAAVGHGGRRRALAMVAVLLVACLVLYWRTPYGGDNGTHGWRVTPWIEVGLRYGFPALGLLGVLAAVGLGRRAWPAWTALAVLVAASVWTVLEYLVPHVVVFVLLIVLGWGLAMLSMGRRIGRPTMLGLAGIVVVLVTIGLGLARESREARRERNHGPVMAAMAAELSTDDVVAVVHSQKLHVAAGPDWKRRVELADLPAPGREREWVMTLRARGVTALLVGHQEPAPDEAEAVRRTQRFIRDSGQFQLIVDYESLTKDLALFRIVPQSSR